MWQKLKNVYAPRARPRTLAIGQAIMQHPNFGKEKSMLENLLNFDALLEQYEMASGQTMPDDLIVSTILRCIDVNTRRHLELTMDDSMTYNTLKEKLILMDKNTKTWSGETYLKNFQMVQAGQSSNSGPTPMEVDQVQYGKGKKGKGKGKKGKWSGFPFGGGKYGGGHKGKGKKGKKGKGKHKGKGKSGKGKGGKNHGADRDQCRICHQYGHWGNECPQLQNANAVNTTPSEAPTTVAASDSVSNAASRRQSTTSTTTASSSTAKGGVRQVKMYHVATPPQEFPETFNVGSEVPSEDETWWVRVVEMRLDGGDWDLTDAEDRNLRETWKEDDLYKWYVEEKPEVEKLHIRAVRQWEEPTLVVLDSGADVSLLPWKMSCKGKPTDLGRIVLEDAQGSQLEMFGKRKANIECETEAQELAVLQDEFVVASVQSPLISLGRLLKKGWTIHPADSETGLGLVPPDRQCKIPLYFKKTSLAVKAHIRQVQVCSDLETVAEEPSAEPVEQMEQEESLVVQTVVKVHEKLLERLGRRGWITSEAGNPYSLQPECKNFIDPSMVYWWQYWPFRSTLIQRSDGTWELVEHCERYYLKDNVTAEIEECGGEATLVLTMMHGYWEKADVFGKIIEETTASGGGTNAESLAFREEPGVPEELDPNFQLQPEELDQPDQPMVGYEENLEWNFEEKDFLIVNENEVRLESPVRLLRAAAEFLGISKAGSKAQLWRRLNNEVQKQEHLRMFELANQLYREEQQHKGLVPVRAPREPSETERALHEVTHVPFRDWCEFCISCKSRSDPQRHVREEPEGRRAVPAIQLDYAYGKSEVKNPLITVLVGVDCWTKMLFAMPLKSKGSNLKLQAEQLVKFSISLNYYDMVEFVADSEPTTKALLESVKLLRQQMGMPTTVTHSKPGDHGRTAQAERAIQTLRRQASTLIEMAEQKCQLKLPGDHALIEWSYLHGAWILNRFSVHSTTKMTPFELVHGRRYAGKVVCFGEVVMVLYRKVGCKQGPQWFPGVWVGKSTASGEDLHLVITPDGLLKGKAVRRTSRPWRSTWLWLARTRPHLPQVSRKSMTILAGTPMIPRAVQDQHPEPERPEVDQEALDVEEHARKHGEESDVEPSGLKTPDVIPFIPIAPLPLGLDDEPTGRPVTPELPQQEPVTPPVEQPREQFHGREQGEMVDDAEVQEPSPKVARRDGGESPSRLYPPTFAGNALAVEEGEVDDYKWEENLYEQLEDDELPEMDEEEKPDEGTPPVLSPEELAEVDSQAGIVEIDRLLEMGVLKDPTEEEMAKGVELSTTTVYDWRFREKRWKRGARFVAREFKGLSKGTAETFAPTAGVGARLTLLLHVIYQWSLCFVDVKDAFLLVPQKTCVLVTRPPWWHPEDDSQPSHWTLHRSLPGQRNAASRWYEFLAQNLAELDFETTPILPSVFRHKTRSLVICTHVDDLILAGKPEDLVWCTDALKQRFTISESGLVPQKDQSPKEAVRFLKKRHYFVEEGLVVCPHEKYIPGLIELYNLENKRAKVTPDIPKDNLESAELTELGKKRFRSAMGTLLYLSQDRVDVQHTVRNLSQFMSKPTVLADEGVRHLILYLKGTMEYGVLYAYNRKSKKKLDELYGKDGGEEDGHFLEVFSDADWAGDKSSAKMRRHSVSSVMLFLDGHLVLSWSRSQKSIALSSCESEYLAAVGGAAEGLFVARVWQFLTREKVKSTAITDSSSCRAFSQRMGVGRLKHIDTKYLWMQQTIRDELMDLEGVATLLNVADLGTKKLSRARREFLMYLIGLVYFNEETDKFEPVGQEEYDLYWQKKSLAANMKEVRKVMLKTLTDGTEVWKPKIPTSMVKAITLLALQPTVYGQMLGEIEEKVAIYTYWLVCIFEYQKTLLFVYTVVIFSAGIFVGLKYWRQCRRVYRWLRDFYYNNPVIEFARPNERYTNIWHGDVPVTPATIPLPREENESEPDFDWFEDWDPVQSCWREFRILRNESDAESGEDYYQYDTQTQTHVRYYKETTLERNERREVEEDMERRERNAKREREAGDGHVRNEEADATSSSSVPRPGLGLDWSKFETCYAYLPEAEARRCRRLIDWHMFNEKLMLDFMHVRLMDFHKHHQDLMFDHPLWWDIYDRRAYRVFRSVVELGEHDDDLDEFIREYHMSDPDNVPFDADE